MEQKHVSALRVGLAKLVRVGGVPIPKSNEISEKQIVMELTNLAINGKDSQVTFDHFPYYLR